MMSSQNSRRNFLSSLAILSAGTVVAGSPGKLFSSDENEKRSPEQSWKTFIKISQASVYFNIAGLDLPVTNTEVSGHSTRRGEIVCFEEENLLAQPTWIYWGNNTAKPADVLINVYENKHPYKRLVALNRYELEALVEISKKNKEEKLLLAACARNGSDTKQTPRVRVSTSIQKRKLSQEISFYKNDSLVFKEKLFYNA